MSAPPIFPLVLRGTFVVCRRHALPLVGLALLTVGPPLLVFFGIVMAIQLEVLRVELDPALDRGGLAMLGIWAIVSVIQLGAVTSGTLRAARGEPFDFGRALRAGVRRSPAVLLASVIAGIAVFAGLSVLVAPGLVALGALCLGVPAAVEEGIAAPRALVRSLDLSRGSRAGLMGSVVVLSALATVAAWGPIVATIDVSPAFGMAYPVLIALFMQLPAVGCAVAYAELRDRKEGRGTAELQRVFE